MRIIPRLLGFGLLSILVLLVMACESTKSTTTEFGSPNRARGAVLAKPESRQIVRFTDSTAEYTTSRSELATAFIREFGDGTVIDKIQVRKAPVDAGGPVTYYIIGMGLRSGSFRAMALPLTSGGDDTYYLRPGAERYILSSVGCPACYFNFDNGRIVGAICSENAPGSHCDLKVEVNNSLFTAR